MIKNICQLLENSVARFPDKVAFSDNKESVTYAEFSDRAKRVGSFLSKTGKRNKPVAVFIDKSVNCLCGLVGVTYSGNFYAIIDTKMPKDRINTILNTLEPFAILTQDKNLEAAKELNFDGEIFTYENAVTEEIRQTELDNIRAKAIDTDPLYALFTSGSTGVPKGAVVCHRSVIAYANWVTETFDITEKTVFGNQTPFYFSMSVLDVFSTLKSGATLHIIPSGLFSFPVKLIEYMNEKQVNTIYWVPSALCIVANFKALDYIKPEHLKKILFAGEVMPVKQLNEWIRQMPEDTLFANLYGPTEITDICTYYVVNRSFDDSDVLPIGNACNNCDVMIITADNKEAEAGQEGELCVRGSFLALGYYDNPAKTSEVFVQNPLNTHYPELIYKTGDIVKYNELGEIIYVSRKDFQIKHMGYRIELGEIEAAFNAVDGVTACVSIYDDVKDKIVLYYVSESFDNKTLLQSVSDKLPKYMCPNKMIKLSRMPYNANGKIDRVKLKTDYKNKK